MNDISPKKKKLALTSAKPQ